ncbi:MAG TPA: NADP-dependent oxidoreductase [Galbitalea sp.]
MPVALATRAYGGPEHYAIINIPTRTPDAHEVVIAVKASGANPVDLKVAAGSLGTDPADLPFRFGYEAAGVITAMGAEDLIGADGVPLETGQAVVAFRIVGAHASEVTVPAKDVLQKPASLSFESAAGLLLAATTAIDALDQIALGAGETVLVHGGGGSVGLATIQLARSRGASVVATAGADRHAQLRALGATPVEYGPGLLERVAAITPRADAAVDTIGSQEAGLVSVALVAEPARLVTITRQPDILAAGGTHVGGTMERSKALRDAARAELLAAAAVGELSVPVVAAYPAAEARAAFELLAGGHAGGKIVLLW